jgi:Glycosyl hydrolase family 12
MSLCSVTLCRCRFAAFFVALVAGFTVPASLAWAKPATGATTGWRSTCTPGAAVTTGNTAYRVVNADSPGGSTCTSVNGSDTQFTVNRSSYVTPTVTTDTQLLDFTGFLSIFTGCKLGACLEPKYPIEASLVQRELVSWSYGFKATGKFDATIDSFFNKTPTQQTIPTGGELMIWLNHQNASLGGPQLPDVTIEGTLWHVYSGYKETDFGNWWRIAFERATPVTHVTYLDIAPFIKASIADGALAGDWYQQDLEAGFEVWSGGVGLSSYSFAAGDPNAGL